MNNNESTEAETTSDRKFQVFVTRTGKSYHREVCYAGSGRNGGSRAAKSAQSVYYSHRMGLVPCTSCKPPVFVAE